MKKTWAPGFTIVELLIVVVVIAILAAITIVAYNGIIAKTNDAAVKNDLVTLQKKVELFIVDNSRRPSTTEIDVITEGFNASKSSYATAPTTDHNLIYCISHQDALTYAIIGYSKSGTKFRVANNEGVKEYDNAWTDQTVACQSAVPDYWTNFRGYAAEDTTNGPWRSWVSN